MQLWKDRKGYKWVKWEYKRISINLVMDYIELKEDYDR